MREFDCLPAELRNWMASAHLPWSPRSVERAYRKALFRTGHAGLAIETLENIQARMIARDAKRVWGDDHPSASR